jgi:hypothetical protein
MKVKVVTKVKPIAPKSKVAMKALVMNIRRKALARGK